MSIDDSLRRIANQAFFERLTVTDDDAIDSEPGVPFDTLSNPEVQATALARQTAGGNGANQTGNVAGLNNDALVRAVGFEPTRSTGILSSPARQLAYARVRRCPCGAVPSRGSPDSVAAPRDRLPNR